MQWVCAFVLEFRCLEYTFCSFVYVKIYVSGLTLLLTSEDFSIVGPYCKNDSNHHYCSLEVWTPVHVVLVTKRIGSIFHSHFHLYIFNIPEIAESGKTWENKNSLFPSWNSRHVMYLDSWSNFGPGQVTKIRLRLWVILFVTVNLLIGEETFVKLLHFSPPNICCFPF